MKPQLIHAGEGKIVKVLANTISIRIHGRDTGGATSVVETLDQPGEGPPPHRHQRESETFYVLEGEYEFTCDGKTFKARKGATVFAPRGRPHHYRNLGKTPGRLMVTFTPAGFEGFFEEVGALSAARQEIPRVAEIGMKYGLEIMPPPTV